MYTHTKTLDEEINIAVRNLELARQQMDYAEDDFLTAAIHNVSAAEERLNALLKQKRN